MPSTTAFRSVSSAQRRGQAQRKKKNLELSRNVICKGGGQAGLRSKGGGNGLPRRLCPPQTRAISNLCHTRRTFAGRKGKVEGVGLTRWGEGLKITRYRRNAVAEGNQIPGGNKKGRGALPQGGGEGRPTSALDEPGESNQFKMKKRHGSNKNEQSESKTQGRAREKKGGAKRDAYKVFLPSCPRETISPRRRIYLQGCREEGGGGGGGRTKNRQGEGKGHHSRVHSLVGSQVYERCSGDF